MLNIESNGQEYVVLQTRCRDRGLGCHGVLSSDGILMWSFIHRCPPTLPRYSFGASQIIFFVDVCYTKKSRLTQNKLCTNIKICDTTGIKSFLYQWYIIFSFFSDLFRCDIINSQLCWCGKLEDTYYYFFTCKKYKEARNVLLNEIFNIVN